MDIKIDILKSSPLLRELNAFAASTRRIASTSSSLNKVLIVYTPALHAASCPAHN